MQRSAARRLTPTARALTASSASALQRQSRRLSSAAGGAGQGQGRLVLGCGSNVVDRFHRVKKMPKVGDKGYFATQKVEEASVVGGVTLNHLSWASVLGVPTGLLALQGTDATGSQIRSTMQELRVSSEFVAVSDAHHSSVSLIFLQDDGERCIVMAPASTSAITGAAVDKHFAAAVRSRGTMVTTEISQVPLSGVERLLSLAKESKLLSMLDVDVPPSVAVSEAGLGTLEQVTRVVRSSDVVKPTLTAALELLELLDPKGPKFSGEEPLPEIAARLQRLLNCQLVALTDGGRGAGMATKDASIALPVFPVKTVVDATGAGDAFFGGMVAGLYHWGMPKNQDMLKSLGQLASASGAACVQVLGALPKIGSNGDSAALISSLHPAVAVHAAAASSASAGAAGSSGGKGAAGSASAASSHAKNGSGPMSGFHSSLESDARSVSAVKTTLEAGGSAAACAAFVDRLLACKGRIFVTGVGKSGLVGRRLAASLSSTGSSAEYVHAAEWLHGDLGKLTAKDCVIALSHSGKTSELLAIVPYIRMRSAALCTIVGNADAPLATKADASIACAVGTEDEPFGLVPSASVIAQEAVGNAIVREMLQRKGFTKKDFFLAHPGGAIGAAAVGARSA